jgi:hypothetical protein
MSLIGTLGEVKIGDVLRLFFDGRKTGALTVLAGPQQAIVRFHKGAIVHATAGRLCGEEAVLDLFGWAEGHLSFAPDDKAPTVTPNVARDVPSLIEEGERLGAALHRTHVLVPSDRVVFQLALGPSDDAVRVSIGGAEWRVIRMLDGVRDVKTVVEGANVPRAEVLRVLCELTEAGFLQRVEVQKVLRAHVITGMFPKEAAEVDDRLRDEWTRIARFESGVARLQVRTLGGRSAIVSTAFRSGLGRDINLPRHTMSDLALREGEDVHVRPMA